MEVWARRAGHLSPGGREGEVMRRLPREGVPWDNLLVSEVVWALTMLPVKGTYVFHKTVHARVLAKSK